MPIHFGTDGWRAVISDSFTFNNLRMVAQAIADAVASSHWDVHVSGETKPNSKTFVVGFDTRFREIHQVRATRLFFVVVDVDFHAAGLFGQRRTAVGCFQFHAVIARGIVRCRYDDSRNRIQIFDSVRDRRGGSVRLS